VNKQRLLIVGLTAVLLAVPFTARAQDAATARSQLIVMHCKEVRTLLDSLQRRDLVARTNLGHEYEATTKLLDAFAQRIHNNNVDDQPYQQLISQFAVATTQFRDAYVHYDDSMNTLKQIDCQIKPADFDAQLEQTRALRDTTEGASTHAAAIVGQYRDMMAALQAQFPASQPAKVGN
jgi:oligoendopeptidase F